MALPGQLSSIVLIEATVVRLVELANGLHNLCGARGHIQWSIAAAHVGAHPAGMQANAQNLLGCQVNAHRFGDRIEGSLGGSVRQQAAIRVGLDGAEYGAHIDYCRALNAHAFRLVGLGRLLKQRQTGLGQHHGHHGICVQRINQILLPGGAEAHRLGCNASVVEEHIKAAIFRYLCNLVNKLVVFIEILQVCEKARNVS